MLDVAVYFEKSREVKGAWELKSKLFLPMPREEVFEFFGNPENLGAITPKFVNFNIVGPAPKRMYAGAKIDYKIKVRGLPLKWRTRINRWEPGYCFVDEQVKGPYSLWIHTHVFDEVKGGTVVRDLVTYKVPGGFVVNQLFVKRDLRKIFSFRAQAIRELLLPKEKLEAVQQGSLRLVS